MKEHRIDRRLFLKMAAAGTAAMAIPGCTRPGSGKKPNVLFVFIDQLRADVCGVYGGSYIETPHIDRLASQGATFANAVSSCPLCTPYRGMVQTGRYPTHSGIVMNFVEASPIQNPHCLGHVFTASGYETGFIGKWHLSSGWRREEGLCEGNPERIRAFREKNPETEYVAPGPGRLGYTHWQAFNFHTAFNDYYFYEDEPKKVFSGRYETDTQVDQAISYMERCKNSGRPFLLCVAPHPPHPPFAPEYIPEGYLAKVPEVVRWSPNVPADNPRKLIEMRYYLAMAKNVDDNLGRLMQYLDASGLAEETIVIFTSDHGDMHGSHGRLDKMVPYAEAMNIPLIFRWPNRIKAGLRLDALQTPLDHLPTLCGLTGMRTPGEVDGVDLSPVILGKSKDIRDEVLIGNYTSHWDFFQTGTRWPEWRGVRTKRYTYCQWLTGKEELYDDIEDPYQMKNLVEGEEEPAVLTRLRGRLKGLLAEAHDDFLPGTAYAEWYDDRRNLIRTGQGPVGG